MAVEIERLLDEHLLIELMPGRRPFGRTGAPGAADVAQRRSFGKQFLEERAHELPRPHVLRFFLQPHDILEPRVGAEYFGEPRLRERIELLDTNDGDVRRRAAPLAAD